LWPPVLEGVLKLVVSIAQSPDLFFEKATKATKASKATLYDEILRKQRYYLFFVRKYRNI
jgi:hypothetical protein